MSPDSHRHASPAPSGLGRRFPGHKLHPSLLREYDLRGVVGETLTEADARAVGRAFARKVLAEGGRRVALAYDGRHSSPALQESLAAGLREMGAAVERIGRGPTPMLYFAVHRLGADAGAMITGSHNPPDYNGIKLVVGARAVFGAELRALGALAAGELAAPAQEGALREVSVFDDYVARLLRDYDGARPLAVAWDAGNGATGEALAALVGRLPGRHILLNERIDGSFPAHHPDPTVAANLVQLQAAVREHGCDLGIAFDGDGDRIGIVDERGRILWGDQITALLARDVLAQNPGALVIGDVKASQVLFDEIARSGGRPLMWKSGHALLRAKLAETGGLLAGEMSGHLFFADRFYGHDDALYAAIRFLSMAARSEASVAEMRDSLPSPANTPELRFPCPEDAKAESVARLKANLRRRGAALEEVDGVRVATADGWWLLRASNTEPVMVARCEAADTAALERVKAHLRAALREAGLAPPPALATAAEDAVA